MCCSLLLHVVCSAICVACGLSFWLLCCCCCVLHVVCSLVFVVGCFGICFSRLFCLLLFVTGVCSLLFAFRCLFRVVCCLVGLSMFAAAGCCL